MPVWPEVTQVFLIKYMEAGRLRATASAVFLSLDLLHCAPVTHVLCQPREL